MKPPASKITPREREVLRACAQGQSHKQVALQLGISVHTVKAHLDRSFNSLGVHSVIEAYLEMCRLSSGTEASPAPQPRVLALTTTQKQPPGNLQLVINIHLPPGALPETSPAD